MSEPPPRSSIAGIWCLAPRKAPVRLVRMVMLQPSMEISVVAAHLASRAGVVECDIKPAEFFHREFDERFRMGFVGDVAGQRLRGAAGFGDLGDQRVEFRLAPRCDDDACALLGKQFRGRAADARTRAGDDGDFSDEAEHHSILFDCGVGFVPIRCALVADPCESSHPKPAAQNGNPRRKQRKGGSVHSLVIHVARRDEMIFPFATSEAWNREKILGFCNRPGSDARPQGLGGAVVLARAAIRIRGDHRRRRRTWAGDRLLPRQGAWHHQCRGAGKGLARRRQHRPQHHHHPLQLPL